MFCIFNPEHDLCLANGSPHYMPPESALRFARQSASLMQILYPEAQACFPAAELPHELANLLVGQTPQIIPWGWNQVLREQLLAQGCPASAIPSAETLARWRNLQHRASILPLQPDSRAVTTLQEIQELIKLHRHLVLKAPWSGSGRGLRWVSNSMSDHDIRWLEKVVHTQRCVIAEPRLQVVEEFALEYMVHADSLEFRGFSLFVSANGVYQANLLLPDETIRQRVHFSPDDQAQLETWLQTHILGQYQGPLGVDYLHISDGRNHLSEFNFRHTMGMVAHQFLLQHPRLQGTRWSPAL